MQFCCFEFNTFHLDLNGFSMFIFDVAEPELLILDEPTVGVDPIIRKAIWDHLVNITSTGKKTVIITTHYIEETRQAHVVSKNMNCIFGGNLDKRVFSDRFDARW